MQAMLNIHTNQRLRELRWEMVCQIHDEIIVEGPAEHANEACALVVDLMEHPFESPLSVDLEVDAKIESSWYKAK
jgi:DNA polymerase-1